MRGKEMLGELEAPGEDNLCYCLLFLWLPPQPAVLVVCLGAGTLPWALSLKDAEAP